MTPLGVLKGGKNYCFGGSRDMFLSRFSFLYEKHCFRTDFGRALGNILKR